VSDTELPAAPPAATHDLGGAPRFRCTPVEPDEDAPPDPFGKRVDALRQLLGARGLMTVDEMRRCIEALPEAEYHALSYYERWLRAISGLMVEKGVVAAEDLR
jgi:hypothetical protein